MKKNFKKVVISGLTAVAFGAISVGTTFALFTDEAKTNVEMQAGKIALTSNASIVDAWELNNVHMVENPETHVWANTIGGSVYKNNNGVIRLDRISPGDGAKIDVTPDNTQTNIKTKVRLAVKLTGELAPALEVKVMSGDLQVIAFKGAKTVYTPWVAVDAGVNPASYSLVIDFPNAENNNDFQNDTADLVVTYEAVQGNASTDDMLEQINTALANAAFEQGENNNMFDALQDLSATQRDAIQERNYVWGANSDQFFSFATAPADAQNYFRMYEAMPTAQDYSIYAIGNNWTTVSGLKVGFDAGATTSITSVEYNRADATEGQEVTIRTNSANTALTINAPLDTVHHFGTAGSLTIVAVANSSYHENGKVAFAEISKGRIVLEEESNINKLHINANANGDGFEEVIIRDNGAEELPSSITRDQVDVEEATRVLKVETGETSEIVYVYPYTDSHETKTGTTEKTAAQNTNVDSALGKLALDNGQDAGEKAMSENEKAAEKEEAIIEEIEEDTNFIYRVGTKGYSKFADAWAASKNSVLHVLKNVTLNAIQVYGGGSYTIDLGENTLTLRGHPDAGTTGGAICLMGSIYGGGDLTITNGKLVMSGENFSTYGIYSYSEDNLTLKDLEIESSCKTVIYATGQQGGANGNLLLDNVAINSTNTSGSALEVYSYKGYWDPSAISYNVTIKNSSVTAVNNAINLYAVNATIEGTSISAQNGHGLWISRAANASGVTGTATLKGVTTIAAKSDYYRLNAADGNTIVILEGTYNFNPSSRLGDALVAIDNGNGTWTVKKAVVKAEVFDGGWKDVYYASLEDALAASKASEDADEGALELFLLSDLDVNITFALAEVGHSYTAYLDLNGYTLSGNIVLNGTTLTLTGGTASVNVTVNDVTVDNETQNAALNLGYYDNAGSAAIITGTVTLNGAEASLEINTGSQAQNIVNNGGTVWQDD